MDIKAEHAKLDNWQLNDNSIEKEFIFDDFKAALAFMVNVGAEAEKLNHHPDWTNSYNKLHIELTTKDKGGLTHLDFDLARAIDQIQEQQG